MRRSLLILLVASPCFAAIPTQTVWEVRPTVGSSLAGGGYVAATTATTADYSIFNNKNAAGCSSCGSSTVDLSTTDAVANGTTTITSATANFSAAKGNIAYFAGGTGTITAVRRQIVSVTNSTTIVLDASIAASTGMTMNIGGALDTLATAMTFATAGNAIYIKDTGVLTSTATTSTAVNGGGSQSAPNNQIIGYTTTRSDNGRARITLSTNSGLIAISGASGNLFWNIRNLLIDCNSLTNSTGIWAYVGWTISNVRITNCTLYGVYMRQNDASQVIDSEIDHMVSGCTAGLAIDGGNNIAAFNYLHDNACISILGSDQAKILNNLVVAQTGVGATAGGIDCTGGNCIIVNNTVSGSNTNCIAVTVSPVTALVRNNIAANCTTGGLQAANAGWPAFPNYDGNFYYNNGTNRVNLDDTGAVNPVYSVAQYTNARDVIGSADPFTSSSNFTLNSTAGGGTAAKGTAVPGTLPGATGTGYMDFGAYQSQYGTGSAGGGNVGVVQ